jgi:membrane protease YdiL (CAAX protease family)
MAPAFTVGMVIVAGILSLYFGVLRGHSILGEAPTRIRAKVAEYGLTAPAAFVLFAVFLALLHSLLEEYYWRWFVFGGLRMLLPFAGAAVLSSLAFMSHHVIILAMFFPGRFWTMAVPLAVCVGIGGLVFAWLYERSRTIYAPWFCHALIDGAIMAVGFDLVFGSPG